jgi:ABC-type glycerol-3-phosphate transport system substrate-binding protein
MTRVRLGVLAVIVTTAAACSGGGSASHTQSKPSTTSTVASTGKTSGISEQRAAEIAIAAWAKEDPSFDASMVRPEADAIADTYDVALVPREITGPGGEPHVVVDRRTGDVVRTYQTR